MANVRFSLGSLFLLISTAISFIVAGTTVHEARYAVSLLQFTGNGTRILAAVDSEQRQPGTKLKRAHPSRTVYLRDIGSHATKRIHREHPTQAVLGSKTRDTQWFTSAMSSDEQTVIRTDTDGIWAGDLDSLGRRIVDAEEARTIQRLFVYGGHVWVAKGDSVEVWSISDLGKVGKWDISDEIPGPNDFALLNHGKKLAIGSRWGDSVWICDALAGMTLGRIQIISMDSDEASVNCLAGASAASMVGVAVSPDHNGENDRVEVFNTDPIEQVRSFRVPGPVRILSFSANGHAIVTVRLGDNTAYVLGVHDGGERTYQLPARTMLTAACLSQDGRLLAIGDNRRRVCVLDLKTGGQIDCFALERHVQFVRVGALAASGVCIGLWARRFWRWRRKYRPSHNSCRDLR